MKQNDLMKMLNLKPQEVKGGPLPRHPPIERLPSTRPLPSRGVSPFALDLDAFDQARGGHLLRHNQEARDTQLSPEALSDFFAMSFLTGPSLSEQECTDPRRKEFVSTTLESPEYRALHRSTELSSTASEIAAVEFARSYAKIKEEDDKRQEKQDQAKKQGKPVDPARAERRAQAACIRAATKALQNASEEVDKLEESLSALGCGPGQGSHDKMDTDKVASLFQRIKDSPTLRRIMELAGRYRRSAQAQQRKKSKHGLDDVVGVTIDGDIGRLVPLELARLATPEFQLDAMRRLVEKQSMCREYRGVEKVGKGPIIPVVDESSSMSGEKVCQAKAFALAMAYIARHQNRWCALVGFAGGTEGNVCVLPPGKWDEVKLVNWLEHFYGGGTTTDVPCEELPNKYWPEFMAQGMKKGITDLILLTDGILRLEARVRDNFLAWKQREKVKCISLILAPQAGDLASVSDQVYLIPRLDLEQQAIQNCLAI